VVADSYRATRRGRVVAASSGHQSRVIGQLCAALGAIRRVAQRAELGQGAGGLRVRVGGGEEMMQLIKRLLFWLKGYRTVEPPRHTPKIEPRTKEDVARLQ
jgi:hypothetical protein